MCRSPWARTVRSEHAVARDLVEHVIEERHPGGELSASSRRRGSTLDDDLRFPRAALDPGQTRGGGGIESCSSARLTRGQCGEQQVVFLGRPDRDSQALSRAADASRADS